jgi:predicted Zn-dependent protease
MTILMMIRKMTRVRNTALILFCVLFAAIASAQSKGNARVNGKILDDEGKPAAGVLVRAIKAGDAAPVEIKTNDKGEWKLENLAAGNWNFEFLKEGFDPQRMSLELTNRNPPIEMKLTKTAAVDPNAELQAGMKQAMELQKSGKGEEARKIISDLIAKYPEAYRLNAFIAQTYAEEKNYDKAIEYLKIVVDKEPGDIDMKTFLAELYTAKGLKEEAQKVLDSVDMTQVKDPTIFINMAISSINAGKADEAIDLLDKVAKQFPTQSNVLYYRARANIVAKKMPEAKADLEKFVSIAPPDARELPDAKKLLEQLKDVK